MPVCTAHHSSQDYTQQLKTQGQIIHKICSFHSLPFNSYQDLINYQNTVNQIRQLNLAAAGSWLRTRSALLHNCITMKLRPGEEMQVFLRNTTAGILRAKDPRQAEAHSVLRPLGPAVWLSGREGMAWARLGGNFLPSALFMRLNSSDSKLSAQCHAHTLQVWYQFV